MDTISIIISSAVVAAIITALTNIFLNRKKDYLKYITSERKEWREKIRLAAFDLLNPAVTDISPILTTIKVNINPYGKQKSRVILEDSHIWDAIAKLEELISSNETPISEVSKKRELLADYLMLLLKMDWERSKTEVAGNERKIATVVLCIIQIILISIFQYKTDGVFNEYFIICMLAAIFMPLPIIMTMSYVKEKIEKSRCLLVFAICSEAILILVCVMHYYSFFVKENINILLGILGLITAITYILSYLYYIQLNFDVKKTYRKEVEKLNL